MQGSRLGEHGGSPPVVYQQLQEVLSQEISDAYWNAEVHSENAQSEPVAASPSDTENGDEQDYQDN